MLKIVYVYCFQHSLVSPSALRTISGVFSCIVSLNISLNWLLNGAGKRKVARLSSPASYCSHVSLMLGLRLFPEWDKTKSLANVSSTNSTMQLLTFIS